MYKAAYKSSDEIVFYFDSAGNKYVATGGSLAWRINKEGRSEQEVIYQLALYDAMLDLDSTNPKTIETYTKQRMKHYEKEFSKISNVTVLDPDPKWKHRFSNSCYQAAVQMITKKYGRP